MYFVDAVCCYYIPFLTVLGVNGNQCTLLVGVKRKAEV